jgi:hypothetical protein
MDCARERTEIRENFGWISQSGRDLSVYLETCDLNDQNKTRKQKEKPGRIEMRKSNAELPGGPSAGSPS